MTLPGTFTFEVAFDVDPAATPSAGDWTDLSARLRVAEGIQITAGSPEGGSCSLSLNNRDRALDPTNTSATLNLVPMRHARLRYTASSVVYDLWRGFVEDWPPHWGEHGTRGLVNVTLVDASVWMANVDVDVDLPAQLTGERVGALLDLAGWPAGDRDVDAGRVQLDAYAQEGGNVLRLLIDTADAEDGDLYVAPDGTLTFHSRHHRLDSVKAWTAGTDVPILRVDPVHGADRIVNVARAEMADGKVFEVTDATSIGTFRRRSEPVRDLPMPWYEAQGLADWIVYRFKDPYLWLDGLEVNATAVPDLVLPRRFGDLLGFTHDPPGAGSATFEGNVEAISHTIDAARWKTRFDLSPYFGEGPWFTWDTAGKGWDQGAKWAP